MEVRGAQCRDCGVVCGVGPDCAWPTALTFREEQCAAYNHRTDLFKSFPGPMDWVPRYTGVAPQDQCKLTCQARALGYYYVLEPRVSLGAGACAHTLPAAPLPKAPSSIAGGPLALQAVLASASSLPTFPCPCL